MTWTSNIAPFLCGIVAAFSWSIGNVLSKAALSSVEPLSLLTGQLAVSAATLSTLSVCWGTPIRLTDWRLGLPGVLQPALAFGLSTFGLAMLPATAETMLFAVETPATVLLAWPLLGERPNRGIGLLCVVAFIGVGLLSWSSDTDFAAVSETGIALVLTGVVSASLYSIAIRRMSRDVDALRLTAASQIVAFIAVGLVWIFVGPSAKAPLTFAEVVLIFASGLLLLAVPFLLYGITLKRLSATAAASLLPLVPLFTAVLASLFLQEMLTGRQWLGAATIVLATFGMPVALHASRRRSDRRSR